MFCVQWNPVQVWFKHILIKKKKVWFKHIQHSVFSVCLTCYFNDSGMGYGSGPAAHGYGFGFQGPPWTGGVDNPASRKRRGGIFTILSFNFVWEIFSFLLLAIVIFLMLNSILIWILFPFQILDFNIFLHDLLEIIFIILSFILACLMFLVFIEPI